MEEQPIKNSKSELFGLSLRDLFYKYVRFLPVFVLSVAISLFGSYLYLRYATSFYKTNATLVISQPGGAGGGSKFDDIFGGGKSQNIQSEIEILRSKDLMKRVVRKQTLQYNYYAIGKFKTINIYKYGPFIIEASELVDSLKPFLLKIKFLNNTEFKVNNDNLTIPFGQYFKNGYGTFRLVKNDGGIGKDYRIEYLPTESAAAMYASKVEVGPKTMGTGILNIGMESTNPNLGADIINQLMDEYGDYTKELKNRTADQMITFIDNRLKVIGRELDSVQEKLLKYSQENNIIDIGAQSSTYLGAITSSDQAINQQNMQLEMLDLINGYLQDNKNKYAQLVVPSSFGLSDGTLNALVINYNSLQIERKNLLNANVPEGHPVVEDKKEQIENVRQRIVQNLSNIKKSYTKIIEAHERNSGKSESQLKILPYKEKGYNQLKRQVDYKQAIVNLLQEKREETAISRASNIANTQIVERAYISYTPVKPNRRSIQIMAIIIGLALPALFVFASEVLNDKVSTRFDVEKITSAPILGEIGHSYSDKVLMVNKTTRSMVAEQFRIVRSNLQYVVGKAEKFTLMVTSSFSGEGKSFLSTNVGAVLALADKKTIILEFDIRKPKVLSGLNMTKGPGITNYLVGKSDNLQELIMQVPHQPNLFVLGCGPVPPNPSELLLGPRVDEMFTWLKERFDVVIIDTAPVGMVSDAQTLGKYADCTLYLVRQGHTFKKQVVLIDEFYRESKLPKVAIIINDVKMKAGYGYYGYGRYGYGYGYGYGSYYEEEHPPKNFLERTISFFDIRRFFNKKKNK